MAPNNNPYSSTIIANIKSEEEYGNIFLWVLLPGPTPEKPPLYIATNALQKLKVNL